MREKIDTTKYPCECMRGIIDKDSIFPNGLTTLNAFTGFQENSAGIGEISVTWNDNNEAVRIIFEQKNKHGEFQFKLGVALVKRSDLDILKRNPQFMGVLNYERKPTADNSYHGNILLIDYKDKRKRNMVASMLAMNAKMVFRDEVMSGEYAKMASVFSKFLASTELEQ